MRTDEEPELRHDAPQQVVPEEAVVGGDGRGDLHPENDDLGEGGQLHLIVVGRHLHTPEGAAVRAGVALGEEGEGAARAWFFVHHFHQIYY